MSTRVDEHGFCRAVYQAICTEHGISTRAFKVDTVSDWGTRTQYRITGPGDFFWYTKGHCAWDAKSDAVDAYLTFLETAK